jgi:hypothetical protein
MSFFFMTDIPFEGPILAKQMLVCEPNIESRNSSSLIELNHWDLQSQD